MKKTILFIIFSLIFGVVGFAQEGKNDSVGYASYEEIRPEDEGKVNAITTGMNVEANSLEHFRTIQRPNISIDFYNNKTINVESSKKIRKILDSHWEKAIEFYYMDKIKSFPDAQSFVDESLKWTDTYSKNREKLENILIKAPNGKRKISANEAKQMLLSLNDAAMEIMAKAKNLEGEYTELKIIKKPISDSVGAMLSCAHSFADISLWVTFDKSATVTKVEVDSISGCPGYDEDVADAAREIEFEPAMQNGKPVTVIKKINYRFTKF